MIRAQLTRSRPSQSVFALSLVLGLAASAAADTGASSRAEQRTAAREAAQRAMVRGPSEIALADQAKLALPEHYGFVPKQEAAELLRLMGNSTGDTFLGVIVPLGNDDQHWFVVLRYDPSGYIKDDDAKHWDADKLLQSLKDGTEAGNARRSELGIPAVEVARWIESPSYDAATHRLVWAAELKNKTGDDHDPGVNYNTYVLGREGYVSLNLITAESGVERDKHDARTLLGLVTYNSGKDYTAFNSSTDKVAAYGLAALVAGVAAKKLGLLAIIGAFVIKFAKVILIAVAAFGAAIAKWFRARFRRSETPST